MQKKVVFVTNTLGRGGAEVALMDLINRLPADWEISLLPIVNRGEMAHRIPERVRLLGGEPDPRPLLSTGGKLKLAGLAAKAAIRTGGRLIPYYRNCRKGAVKPPFKNYLWRLYAENTPALEEEYDLAVAFLEGAATQYTARRVNAKHKACFVHVNYERAGYSREQDDGCYAAYDRIFTVSESLRRGLCGVYPEYADHIFVLRNFVDTKKIRDRAKEPANFGDDFTGTRLVTVGRLTYQKAYDIAIPAFAELKKLYDKPVRWYVLGGGEERNNLEKLAAEYGVQEDFIFMGDQENPYPMMAAADIYVHATRFEGSSIALREAQVLGKAIIASDCPENEEILIRDENALLTALTPEDIAATIMRFLTDDALREKCAAAALAVDQENEVGLERLTSLAE